MSLQGRDHTIVGVSEKKCHHSKKTEVVDERIKGMKTLPLPKYSFEHENYSLSYVQGTSE